MYKKGFTLAEILITIGILGVIAALTLPALNSDVNKQALEKQTLKFASQMEKGLTLYKIDKGADSLSDTRFDRDNFVKQYLNISGKCTTLSDCLPESYANINKAGNRSAHLVKDLFDNSSTFLLADGTVFGLTDSTTFPKNIFFDVNGKKGPNVIGYDFWRITVFDDGTIDEDGITPEVRTQVGEDGISKAKTIAEEKFQECLSSAVGGCYGHFKRNNYKFDY